jgi:hypothetical protein
MKGNEGKREIDRKRDNLKTIADGAYASLSCLAETACNGDVDAAFHLYRVTGLGAEFLRIGWYMNADVFRMVSEGVECWPLMFNSHRDVVERSKAFVKTIGLGSQTGNSLTSTRAPSKKSNPAIAVVDALYKMAQVLIKVPRSAWGTREWLVFMPLGRFDDPDQINWAALDAWGQTGAGTRLPKLSKSTAHLWAKATVELFDLVYGEKFDEHPDLSDLRHHHRNAKDSAGVKNSVSAVQRAMRQAIKQAWRGYAAGDK